MPLLRSAFVYCSAIFCYSLMNVRVCVVFPLLQDWHGPLQGLSEKSRERHGVYDGRGVGGSDILSLHFSSVGSSIVDVIQNVNRLLNSFRRKQILSGCEGQASSGSVHRPRNDHPRSSTVADLGW